MNLEQVCSLNIEQSRLLLLVSLWTICVVFLKSPLYNSYKDLKNNVSDIQIHKYKYANRQKSEVGCLNSALRGHPAPDM